ncbi:hypothetical protein WJ971_19015 [Achromobacter xylosoxidans]
MGRGNGAGTSGMIATPPCLSQLMHLPLVSPQVFAAAAQRVRKLGHPSPLSAPIRMPRRSIAARGSIVLA